MPDTDQVEILTFGRCEYLTKTNRRCRSQIVYPDGRYCRQHILTQESKGDFELLLTDQALRFHKIRGIHNSLQRLYGLLAAGEISPRRAATLAYIANMLIRHLPGATHADSRACRCNGFPHSPHEVYPDPASPLPPEDDAFEENSAAITNSASPDASHPAAASTQLQLLSIPDSSESAKQPGSANLN